MGPPTDAEADAMESPFARTMLESLQPPSRVIGWKARLPNPSPNPHPGPDPNPNPNPNPSPNPNHDPNPNP